MKGLLRAVWRIYNFFVNILGHICVLALLVAFGYYLHTQGLLYFVLLGIIGLLILAIIIICINASITKKKLRGARIDTKDFEKSAKKLSESLKK